MLRLFAALSVPDDVGEALQHRQQGIPGARWRSPGALHVTLAYLKHAEPARVGAWIQGHNLLKSPPWRAAGFGLYSSQLGPDGSAYRLEREYWL